MRLVTSTVCSLALCVACVGAVAQSTSPLPASAPDSEGFSRQRLARVDNFMRELVTSGDYLGGVTLIVRNGKIVDWRAYGHHDLAKKRPMTKDSIFRIYSMTKTVASVALLTLLEEGKFAIDDPIAKFIPEFANTKVFADGTAEAPQLRAPKRQITIRHLLTHTGGIATHGAKDSVAVALFNRIDVSTMPTIAAYADHVARQALAADPGEVFAYDGVSLVVASRLIEVISGVSFDAFLRQRILAPLKMHDTDFHVPHAKRARIVDMVTTDENGRLAIAATHDARHPGEPLNPYASAAGGLYSTAADYARFCQMLLNGGSLNGVSILGRKTVELMMMNHLGDARVPESMLGKGEVFGLGGYLVEDVARRGRLGSVGQFGWSGAGSTYFTIDRRERMIAMLLMQHLPQGLPKDPPKVSAKFYNLVYQSLGDSRGMKQQ